MCSCSELSFLGALWGGVGDGGKVGRWARRGQRRPSGAAECSGRWLSPCGPSHRRHPQRALGPQASAALTLLLRPELAGAAHSNTGGCAAHPTRAAAATPGTRPLTARARPPDTPPLLLRSLAAWRAPPLGEVSCEPRLHWRARPGLTAPGSPSLSLGLRLKKDPSPSSFVDFLHKLTTELSPSSGALLKTSLQTLTLHFRSIVNRSSLKRSKVSFRIS